MVPKSCYERRIEVPREEGDQAMWRSCARRILLADSESEGSTVTACTVEWWARVLGSGRELQSRGANRERVDIRSRQAAARSEAHHLSPLAC